VRPQVFLLGSEAADGREVRGPHADEFGKVVIGRGEGGKTLRISSPAHEPASVSLPAKGSIQVVLEPLEIPGEIRPERIRSLLRADATLILGYVVDEESGRPLSGVTVSSPSGNVSTRTDEHGFFQLHLPLPFGASEGFADLSFRKPGYAGEVFRNVELWPLGDWTYRVRLTRGGTTRVTDENDLRRRAPHPRKNEPRNFSADPTPAEVHALEVPPDESAGTASSPNTTLRVPRNIRVQLADGTIEYVSMELYVRRSLPREWIASWNNQPGGINSLKAGAVAIRSYGAWHVSNPRGSDYDICATTSCQVYGSTTSTATDAAVNQTTHHVVVTSSGLIARSEYSAENNSFGFPCGDGFTSPTGGCLSDPVCTGEERYGHGRGMCQWGTIRWASGRRFQGRSMSDTTSNGHPQRDWIWIVEHYYPQLKLMEGAPLVVGDPVRVTGTSSLTVRLCVGGGIEAGMNCPQVTTRSSGATGVILDGPVRVTADGRGFTWWKIQWNDAGSPIGWSPENWLERIIPVPPAPGNPAARAISSSEIELSWTDNSDLEHGFAIQRALASGGPWTQAGIVGANTSSYADTGLSAGATYFYRIRAFNLGGESPWSSVISARTSGVAPVLSPIPDRTIDEGSMLIFTNAATAEPRVTMFADFENFAHGTGSGTVLFRAPSFSGSTSALLEASPNVTSVTENFPSGISGARALHAAWNWKAGSNPWLRLTTFGTANLPNPVIDFRKQLRFDIHADRPLLVGLGLRETVVASGTPIGANGGTSGDIEWAGVTNNISGQPRPTRRVPAAVWTTLTFDLPGEPIAAFFNGNNVLHTENGLGVLEHLAFVPSDGAGTYNVYLDNFSVVAPRRLTYSLDPGAPAGAAIDPATGLFTWTPTEAQGPGSYPISVRVSDDSSPPESAATTFRVTVREVNRAPLLAPIANRTVHAGSVIAFAVSASDPDIPANTLTFSLDPGAPPGASIHPQTGLFSWTPADAEAGAVFSISVRVADNGSPPLSDSKLFTVAVAPPPGFDAIDISETEISLLWSALPGTRYRVQYKNDLSESAWTNLTGDLVAESAAITATDARGEGQRFYRILLVD
jgi:hypothetical protein